MHVRGDRDPNQNARRPLTAAQEGKKTKINESN